MSLTVPASGFSEPGELLGDYEILESVGAGGMGIVYKARQRSLGRIVAVKVIRDEIASVEEYRERFHREARMAASVDHPHVVSVHEVVEVNRSLLLVMQWIEGNDLKRVIETVGRLAPERAVIITSQIAGALDAVHSVRGLVHRDVKPANVLLRRVGDADHAYLTDFGVAKPSESSDPLTRTGWLVGTSGYLAPEQIKGQEPGPRSDLYALGCLFFETLTGRPPFIADNEMALRWAHASDPRPLASTVVPELGQRYDWFLSVALALDPGQRFGSGREFAEALAATQVGHDWATGARPAIFGMPAPHAGHEPAPHVTAVDAAHPAMPAHHADVTAAPPFALTSPEVPVLPLTSADPPGLPPVGAATPLPAGTPVPLPVGPPIPVGMQTPAPPYPMYAYVTPAPPAASSSRASSPLALILLALTALAGITAGVLAAAGVFSQQPVTQSLAPAAARVASTRHARTPHFLGAHHGRRNSLSSQTGSTSNQQAPPQGNAQNLADPGAPAASSLAGAALQSYWTLVNTGHYRRAFALETPNEQSNEPSFVSDKKAAQPMVNVVSVGPASASSGTAEVPISFYAQDRYASPGSDTICRYFQMTADMVQMGGGTWLYDGPVSGTAQVTEEPGSSSCHS